MTSLLLVGCCHIEGFGSLPCLFLSSFSFQCDLFFKLLAMEDLLYQAQVIFKVS